MPQSSSTLDAIKYFLSHDEETQRKIARRSSAIEDLVWIAALARSNQTQNTIEIGTFLGLSATFIAPNISGRLYTINISEKEVEQAEKYVRGFGVSNVDFIVGDSLKKLSSLTQNITGLRSLVYVDGNHSYKYSMGEYQIVAPYISNGAVVFDDADKPHPDGAKDGGVPRTVAETRARPIGVLNNRVACLTFGNFRL